jgi:hypothetical protein
MIGTAEENRLPWISRGGSTIKGVAIRGGRGNAVYRKNIFSTVLPIALFTAVLLVLVLSGANVSAQVLVASRTVTSFGQDYESRAGGVAFRPGFNSAYNPAVPALQSLVAAREITYTGNDPLLLAASELPSGCTLIVAEGVSPGMAYIWEMDGEYQGTYYSTGSEGSAFPYGAKITDFMHYDRNSVFMEMPSIGFPIQQFFLTGRTSHAKMHVEVPPVTRYTTNRPNTKIIDFRVGGYEGDHLEIGNIQGVTVKPNDPYWPDYTPGSIVMFFDTNIVGNFDPLDSVRFRVYCDDQFGTVRDLIGPGAAWCVYAPDYKDTLVNITVVAGSLGPGASPSGVFVVEPPPQYYDFDTFRCLGSTIGDTASFILTAGGGGDGGGNSTISGRITADGVGLAGVMVNLTGPTTAAAATDADGYYSISGLYDGTYTVAPGKAGCTFNPPNIRVDVTGWDVPWQDFAATCYNMHIHYEIDKVTGTNYDCQPRDTSHVTSGDLPGLQGYIPVSYHNIWNTGHSNLIAFVDVAPATPGPTAQPGETWVTINASASWDNQGLGCCRYTGIFGPTSDEKGCFDNGSISAHTSYTGPLTSTSIAIRGHEAWIVGLSVVWD